MKLLKLNEFKNPFDAITIFAQHLAFYTGAPFVVLTDSCTHAIELCFRYKQAMKNCPSAVTLPNRTYLSVPMVFHKLGINYDLLDQSWNGEYNIGFTNVWDSARKLHNKMYLNGQMQCLSFGRTKPIELGRGGAILLDDADAYVWLKKASYDGRDLDISPWQDQKTFQVGYHYMMRPEEAIIGINKLIKGEVINSHNYTYPDLNNISIKS
jgi:dTDP-4-amino-4,6-dideoxygalactose transaminase